MGWMYWTAPTTWFFVAIGLMLGFMTVWEIRSPCVARRGFLPMATTRGDRLFVGLLTVAFANLAWAGLTDVSQWIGFGASLLLFAIVVRWG